MFSLRRKSICLVVCPLALLKPDLEIFKTEKFPKFFKRKTFPFPSMTLGLLIFLSVFLTWWDSGLVCSKLIPWVSGGSFVVSLQLLLLSALQWWLFFLMSFSLKSLTFEILGLLNLQSVLPWLRPTLNPGPMQTAAMDSGVESETEAFPSPRCFQSPQGQPEGSDKNKRWSQCACFQFLHSRTLWTHSFNLSSHFCLVSAWYHMPFWVTFFLFHLLGHS